MLDSRITQAIEETVRSHGQSSGLSDKIVRWMEDLARGGESLDDRDAVQRRLELIYAATSTKVEDQSDSQG